MYARPDHVACSSYVMEAYRHIRRSSQLHVIKWILCDFLFIKPLVQAANTKTSKTISSNRLGPMAIDGPTMPAQLKNGFLTIALEQSHFSKIHEFKTFKSLLLSVHINALLFPQR